MYSVPDGDVSSHASKVNKLSTTYEKGKKVLLKGDKVVASDVSPEDALINFVNFLENKTKNGSKIVLIAHNGNTFDFPILMNSLAKFSLVDRVKVLDVLFLDSLKVFKSLDIFKENKTAKKLNLSSIYNSLFAQEFEAHDALGDCQALSEVLLAIQLRKCRMFSYPEKMFVAKWYPCRSFPFQKPWRKKWLKLGLDLLTWNWRCFLSIRVKGDFGAACHATGWSF